MESAMLSRATNASSHSRPSLLAALRKPQAASSDSSAESDNESYDSDRASIRDDTNTQSPVDKNLPHQDKTNSRTTSPQPTANILANEDKDDGDDDGAAYERMKQRLAAAKASKTAQQPKVPVKEQPIPTVDVSSEEDDIPVQNKARRMNSRKGKSASPSASPIPSVRSRRSSPGLFVTPHASHTKQQTHNKTNVGSDSDTSSRPRRTKDLQERVQRIRAERLAKQQEEQSQQKKQKAASKAINRRLQQNEDSGSDGENGRRLTQQAKPTRKAGKKALEAMARDQQRISRNMQLTHQAKTRKKHTVKDLFSRFGFDRSNGDAAAAQTLPTPEPSSVLASSDAEANQSRETPPTSPPTLEDQEIGNETVTEISDLAQGASLEARSKEVPSPPKLDKGKGRAPEFQHLPLHPWMRQTEQTIVQNARVSPKECKEAMIELSDSDDDEAAQTNKRFAVFDRIPLKQTQESSSLLHLRHLAHLTSPKDVRKGVRSISFAEMQLSLAQKARQQAQNEREEKIAELRRRGIHIETEEEREKSQMEIEDMVAQLEKQRQGDLKLAKLEREEAKKNGEIIDDLPSSDESDEDYVGSGEDDAEEAVEAEDDEEAELYLSGSEDEDMGSGAEHTDHENTLLDDEAELEVAPQEQQLDEDADMEDEEISAPTRKRTSNRARNLVVDDEDDEDEPAPVASPTQPATPNNAMDAFGFGNAKCELGLTQMFAGTMANLESGPRDAAAVRSEPEQDSLDFLRSLPDTQPGANFSQTSDFMVPNSQSLVSPQKESHNGMETQFSLGISQLIKTSPAFSRTQLEDFPEPTQDAGFSFSRSPAGLMPPPSTVDTVMMTTVAESPIKQRKSKLQRGRKSVAVELSDVEDDLVVDEVEADLSSSEDDIQRPPKHRDAFAKLAKGARKQKAVADFDKKNSLAKNAVMEQAEESEDEYAGIGGASDDESGEEDEETKKMIEHGEVDVDERQLAAFYADKAKKEDEKNFNELYKNVMNGGLRRRAGGRDGFNISDSEDEEDMRLRKKRAEFQKMSRALLADERIGNIAKDEKKQAFFHTLADFADEGDYEFLDMPAEPSMDVETSQSQEQQEEQDITVPDSQAEATDMPTRANPLKRKSPPDSQKENRPPPNLGRTAAADGLSRKPITLADVQHSVSELLEDSRVMVPDSQYSESESGDESPAATKTASRKTIVDRLSLSRTSSLSSSAGDANAGGLAFHAPSRSLHAPGFRVPSLIRQATSNLSATSESRRSSGASTPTETVRRGGTGRSNIHAQAREAERRQLLEKKDSKRREALKKKVSAGRRAGMRSVLGDLGGGFEY